MKKNVLIIYHLSSFTNRIKYNHIYYHLIQKASNSRNFGPWVHRFWSELLAVNGENNGNNLYNPKVENKIDERERDKVMDR